MGGGWSDAAMSNICPKEPSDMKVSVWTMVEEDWKKSRTLKTTILEPYRQS